MSTADVPAKPVGAGARAKPAAAASGVQWISWIALALMTTSSVASLRPGPTMGVYGVAAVFL